jgi:peptidoglycan/LPS O-acetylase OafA/YrhL
VSAGFWDTFVSVDVVPDVDAVIMFERRRVRNLLPLLFVALLLVALALAMIVAFY